jgi:hypothetical protein
MPADVVGKTGAMLMQFGVMKGLSRPIKVSEAFVELVKATCVMKNACDLCNKEQLPRRDAIVEAAFMKAAVLKGFQPCKMNMILGFGPYTFNDTCKTLDLKPSDVDAWWSDFIKIDQDKWGLCSACNAKLKKFTGSSPVNRRRWWQLWS